MEFGGYDLLAAFSGGIGIGLMFGHWISKQERRLEYERGKLDGINYIWPYYVEEVWGRILRRDGQHGANKKVGGDGGAGQAV